MNFEFNSSTMKGPLSSYQNASGYESFNDPKKLHKSTDSTLMMPYNNCILLALDIYFPFNETQIATQNDTDDDCIWLKIAEKIWTMLDSSNGIVGIKKKHLDIYYRKCESNCNPKHQW